MATQQLSTGKKRSYSGSILVILGFAALVADLAFLATPLERLIERLKDGLFGVAPALGLSFLNAVRAIALHQLDYFSLIARILVLFSAMLALIVGLALLRSHSAGSTGATDLSTSEFRERETDNG
jgi:hypothetical protein